MSRGLSQQQRRILGLAYSFNVQLNGGIYASPGIAAPAGDKYREGYKHLLVSESTTPPDFFPWMLEHYVAGVSFKTQTRYGRRNAFYEWTAEARCAKASLRRAVTTLWDQGYLADHVWKKQSPGPSTIGNVIEHGYALAPQCIEIGKQNVLDIGDAIKTVCGMLEQTDRGGIWDGGGVDSMAIRIERLARLSRGSVTRGPRGPEVTDKESVTSFHANNKVTINQDGSLTVKDAA